MDNIKLIRQMNRSVLLFAMWGVVLTLTAQSAYPQAMSTPSGELRLGMTKDQVTRLLHSEVTEGGDPEGFFQPRTVNAKFDNRQVSGILTTKGIVYSIYSHESFPADSDVKPAAIPIKDRPPFRFEAGHRSNQRPASFRH